MSTPPMFSSSSFSSASSVSDSFHMSGEPVDDVDIIGINSQLLVLSDETDLLNIHINRGYGFQQEIYDHKVDTKDQMKKMKEKMAEMQKTMANTDQLMKVSTEARVAEVLKNAEPYLASGRAPNAGEQDMMETCGRVLANIRGINATMAKTKDLSANVMRHHQILDRVEQKQRDAIARYEEATRVENLTHDVSPTDPLYHMAHLPKLLLAFSLDSDLSPSYTQVFKDLEQRMAALVAQLRFNSTANEHPEFSGSLSSMTNGEIDVKSLLDAEEHPLDSLRVKTPETVQ